MYIQNQLQYVTILNLVDTTALVELKRVDPYPVRLSTQIYKRNSLENRDEATTRLH